MNKKKNIIQTAAHLLAVQGFEGTPTLQIANKAGVKEPLIYYHFTGKDELFTHILKYLDWSSKVVEGCRGCNSALEHYYDQILRQGRHSVEKDA